MDYQLVYTKRAVKDIRRLDQKVKQCLESALEKLSEDPIKSMYKLSNP